MPAKAIYNSKFQDRKISINFKNCYIDGLCIYNIFNSFK